MPQESEYLGDGVYASWDGYHIWLSLEAQDPRIRIALEPSVYTALVEYHAKLMADLEAERNG